MKCNRNSGADLLPVLYPCFPSCTSEIKRLLVDVLILHVREMQLVHGQPTACVCLCLT